MKTTTQILTESVRITHADILNLQKNYQQLVAPVPNKVIRLINAFFKTSNPWVRYTELGTGGHSWLAVVYEGWSLDASVFIDAGTLLEASYQQLCNAGPAAKVVDGNVKAVVGGAPDMIGVGLELALATASKGNPVGGAPENFIDVTLTYTLE